MRLTFRTLLVPALSGACLLVALNGQGNNIQITNTTLTGNTGTSVQVQFDLSWENSWRGGGVINWDAAWVFVKYRTSLTGPWLHVKLGDAGHIAPAGSQLQLGFWDPHTPFNGSNPGVGAFISRSANGTGTFSLTGVQLNWAYAFWEGLAYNDIAQVQVFAIEMVYVPQGAFFVGSGGTETGSFTNGAWTSGATIPLQIASEGAITIAQTPGDLWGTSSDVNSTIGGSGTLPAAYPKGFNAFYCMKYELSQQQYVDFLNTLTYTQQDTRTGLPPFNLAGTGALSTSNTNRNGIDIQIPGVASTTPAVFACNLNGNTTYGEPMDGKDIACNFLSLGDLTAYLDWSGLRPMTELEFEKACRGSLAPVPDEYPWGTTGIRSGAIALLNAGATNEGISLGYSSTLGNANYNTGSFDYPLRAGIFAANGSNSGRVTAGASYYGIMELGGNLWEYSVSIGKANGRAFNGGHGNGVLSASGDPMEATWPALAPADGTGFRGGTFDGSAAHVRVSDRFFGALTPNHRGFDFGGRGVRLVP